MVVMFDIETTGLNPYNNLKFDVPFMAERLKLLGKWKSEFYAVFSKKWFDLYQHLGNDYRSLKFWLRKAGIKRDFPDLDGRMFLLSSRMVGSKR
jgi:uncharacterized protein YprB with RNaseH-like and TPR domain